MNYSRIALLFGLLGLLACTKAVKPLPDKNTNWLRACDVDAECGSELACLCGACTKACESDAQCVRTAPGATCLAAGDPSIQAVCGKPLKAAAVCSAECKRDSDCDAQADGLRCEAGLCVPDPARCETESCDGFPCAAGSQARAECDAEGAVSCSCVPETPEACTPGDVVANICGMDCPGLNENAFATCGADGHYGPCTCQNPRCGPALDCAAGFVCFGNRCLAAATSCGDALCEPGAECLDGLCVKVLVDGLSSPGDLGVTFDNALYFVNTGTYDAGGQFKFDAMLARVPLAGGAYERVREDLNEIGRMVVVESAAYWFNAGKGIPFQVTGKLFFSDQPTSIFLTGPAVSPLVADDEAFYWLERKDPNGPVDLMTASRAVLQPEARKLLELPEPTTVLANGGARLYWGTVDSGLWSVNKDGSDVRRDVEPRAELQGPSALAIDGTGVYWSWTSGVENVGLGLYGGGMGVNTRLTEDMSARLGDHLALDTDNVYWIYAVSGDTQYSLARTRKTPYETQILWRSSQLTAATKILAHEGFVYLSTLPEPGQGKILRIQLPLD